MARAFVLELLWLFFFPKERGGFPFFCHRGCPDQPPLAPGVPKQVIWCVIYRTWSLFVTGLFERPSLICLSVGSIPRTQSHSATTLAYESIPHASTTGSTHAANGGADHAPTCAYRLASFPLAHVADTILRFSHCISTYSNGALNPPRIVASAGVGVETVVPPLPTPPSIVCLRRAIENHK